MEEIKSNKGFLTYKKVNILKNRDINKNEDEEKSFKTITMGNLIVNQTTINVNNNLFFEVNNTNKNDYNKVVNEKNVSNEFMNNKIDRNNTNEYNDKDNNANKNNLMNSESKILNSNNLNDNKLKGFKYKLLKKNNKVNTDELSKNFNNSINNLIEIKENKNSNVDHKVYFRKTLLPNIPQTTKNKQSSEILDLSDFKAQKFENKIFNKERKLDNKLIDKNLKTIDSFSSTNNNNNDNLCELSIVNSNNKKDNYSSNIRNSHKNRIINSFEYNKTISDFDSINLINKVNSELNEMKNNYIKLLKKNENRKNTTDTYESINTNTNKTKLKSHDSNKNSYYRNCTNISNTSYNNMSNINIIEDLDISSNKDNMTNNHITNISNISNISNNNQNNKFQSLTNLPKLSFLENKFSSKYLPKISVNSQDNFHTSEIPFTPKNLYKINSNKNLDTKKFFDFNFDKDITEQQNNNSSNNNKFDSFINNRNTNIITDISTSIKKTQETTKRLKSSTNMKSLFSFGVNFKDKGKNQSSNKINTNIMEESDDIFIKKLPTKKLIERRKNKVKTKILNAAKINELYSEINKSNKMINEEDNKLPILIKNNELHNKYEKSKSLEIDFFKIPQVKNKNNKLSSFFTKKDSKITLINKLRMDFRTVCNNLHTKNAQSKYKSSQDTFLRYDKKYNTAKIQPSNLSLFFYVKNHVELNNLRNANNDEKQKTIINNLIMNINKKKERKVKISLRDNKTFTSNLNPENNEQIPNNIINSIKINPNQYVDGNINDNIHISNKIIKDKQVNNQSYGKNCTLSCCFIF